MCNKGCGSGSKELGDYSRYFKALHCPTRWVIIRSIGDGTRSTGEILKALTDAGEGVSRSALYYHLSELEDAGLIELAEYREEGGGAPEKVWRLKTRHIKIDLLKE